MKKKMKKISLSKETLRALQPQDIRQAEGGGQWTFSCHTLCDCNTDLCSLPCE
jgi:hypothetical protein